ncbi:hypothetical protein Ciccas_010391 [Cichlidogyrus casuarinus]|uniref:Uncharacterized protein n=1 Tax=Cichlidogyrus casuarinus TaxID=1844966 RepID=A0ABD2PU89_9PLAT
MSHNTPRFESRTSAPRLPMPNVRGSPYVEFDLASSEEEKSPPKTPIVERSKSSTFVYNMDPNSNFDADHIDVSQASDTVKFALMFWSLLNMFVKPPVPIIADAIGGDATLTQLLEETLTGIFVSFIALKLLQDRGREELCLQLAKAVLFRMYQVQVKMPDFLRDAEMYLQKFGLEHKRMKEIEILNEDDLWDPLFCLEETTDYVKHPKDCHCGAQHSNYPMKSSCTKEKCLFVRLVIQQHFLMNQDILLRMVQIPLDITCHPMYTEVQAFFSVLITLQHSNHFHTLVMAKRALKERGESRELFFDGTPAFKFLIMLAFILHSGENYDGEPDYLAHMMDDFIAGVHNMEDSEPSFIKSEYCKPCKVLAMVVFNFLVRWKLSLGPLVTWLNNIREAGTEEDWEDLINTAHFVNEFSETDLCRVWFKRRLTDIKKFDYKSQNDSLYWQILRDRSYTEIICLCDRACLQELYIAMLLTAEVVRHMYAEGEDLMAMNLILRVIHYIQIVWADCDLVEFDRNVLELKSLSPANNELSVLDGIMTHVAYFCICYLLAEDGYPKNWNLPPNKSQTPAWVVGIAELFCRKRHSIMNHKYVHFAHDCYVIHDMKNVVKNKINPLINQHSLDGFFEAIMMIFLINIGCITRQDDLAGRKSLVQFAATCLYKQAIIHHMSNTRLSEMKTLHSDINIELASVKFSKILRSLKHHKHYKKFIKGEWHWVKKRSKSCALEKLIDSIPETSVQQIILLSIAAFTELLQFMVPKNMMSEVVKFTQIYLDFIDTYDQGHEATNLFKEISDEIGKRIDLAKEVVAEEYEWERQMSALKYYKPEGRWLKVNITRDDTSEKTDWLNQLALDVNMYCLKCCNKGNYMKAAQAMSKHVRVKKRVSKYERREKQKDFEKLAESRDTNWLAILCPWVDYYISKFKYKNIEENEEEAEEEEEI